MTLVGPLRLRVPRQLGYKSVKYINRLAVTDGLKRFGKGLSSAWQCRSRPTPQLLVEEMDVVADAFLVEELMELLIIDAVGPFDFAIQMWCSGFDVDVADVQAVKMPMNL